MLRGYTRNRIVSEGARDWSKCPAGPMSVPGRTNLNARRDQSALFHLLADLIISAVCFWRPVCLCFVFIPGQYFFFLLFVTCFWFHSPALVAVVLSSCCFLCYGILFAGVWWLVRAPRTCSTRCICPTVVFSWHVLHRPCPVCAAVCCPCALLCSPAVWRDSPNSAIPPLFAPFRPSARPVTRTGADVVEAHPSLFWCQDSAVVCLSASRLRGELVTVWAWAVCRLQ